VLVQHSLVRSTHPGQVIGMPGDRHGIVQFVIDGLVVLRAKTPWREREFIVDIFPGGRFVVVEPPPDSDAWRDVSVAAIAVTDGLIASTSYDVALSVVSRLSPECLRRLMHALHRSACVAAYRRTLQTGVPLAVKVRLEMDYLEHRLRWRRRPGERPIYERTHIELADEVGASRSAVTRALGAMENTHDRDANRGDAQAFSMKRG
jgi:hypothetical protein